MFGFQRLGKSIAEARLPHINNTTSMVLVSKEDIYREGRGQTSPILLLRKGQEVDPNDLDKLIQNGARPEQFCFHYRQGNPKNALTYRPADLGLTFSQKAEQKGMSNPITAPDPAAVSTPGIPATAISRRHTERMQKNIVILDVNQKSLKRLIDCMFVCGFNLGRIHPVRIPSQLSWSINRHKPNILIMDYTPAILHSPILRSNPFLEIATLEQVVLTVDPQFLQSMADKLALQNFCDEKGIKILMKPVSRFALNQVFEAQGNNPTLLTISAG